MLTANKFGHFSIGVAVAMLPAVLRKTCLHFVVFLLSAEADRCEDDFEDDFLSVNHFMLSAF